MAEIITTINEFSSDWAEAMWAVVWQSTLLALLVAVLLRAWRGLSPAARCWIWRVVAIKLLVLPFWTLSVPLPRWWAVPSTSAPETVQQILAADSVVQPDPALEPAHEVEPVVRQITPMRALPKPTWQAWLAGIWLAVVALQLVRIGWQRRELRRLMAASRPAEERLRQLVAIGAAELGLGKTPEVRITDVEVSPFVCGLAQPYLVLPESLTDSHLASQLRQIVLHELAHVRRHDLLWCWVTHAMRMAFWFHPISHWVAFREALERELACDELAMVGSGATAADYAQTLVEAASRTAMPAVLRAAAAAHFDGGRGLG
jgi:beta-lactamase regulating signal transducer with metallopeptidase domain